MRSEITSKMCLTINEKQDLKIEREVAKMTHACWVKNTCKWKILRKKRNFSFCVKKRKKKNNQEKGLLIHIIYILIREIKREREEGCTFVQVF